jgi:hypothetical protein
MRKFLAATGSHRYDPWERKYVSPPLPLSPLDHPGFPETQQHPIYDCT